jgi:hypothetical protein
MSARQENNVNFAVVGGNAVESTGTVLNEGEIGLFKANGTRLTTAGAVAGEKFYIALGGANNKPAFVSDVIDGSKITSITTKAPVAAAEQLDYIGFNGTSGDIDEIMNNLYMATVHIQEYLTSNTDGRYIKHFQYKSGSTPDKHAIAKGLVASAINNFSREAEDYLAVALVSAEPGDAIAGAPTSFTFTAGSKVVTWAGTDPTNVAAGEFLRVGTSPADPIYEIESVDAASNLLVLVHKYNGATATIAVAGVEVVELADFDAAAVGVRLVGKPLSWRLGKEFYKKVRWDLQIGAGDGMGTTEVTNTTGAAEGSGQYEQVAELEWFTAGNRGEYFRMGEPSIFEYDKKAAAGISYDITAIDYVDDVVVGIGATPTSKKQITLCTNTVLTAGGAEYMDHANDPWAILDAIYSGTVTPV